MGFPGSQAVKNLPEGRLQCKRLGIQSLGRKIPGKEMAVPLQYSFFGIRGQRSVVGYSHTVTKLDMT